MSGRGDTSNAPKGGRGTPRGGQGAVIPASFANQLVKAGRPEENILLDKYKALGLVAIRSTYMADGIALREYGVWNQNGSVITWLTHVEWESRKAQHNVAVDQSQKEDLMKKRLNKDPAAGLQSLTQAELELIGKNAKSFRDWITATFPNESGVNADSSKYRFNYDTASRTWKVLTPANSTFR